ncbi:MAG TPA: ATP-grasp domain-containing protein [Phycisphaerae bacterium]|jgi:carbamoyl-phosphate synthase large subunit
MAVRKKRTAVKPRAARTRRSAPAIRRKVRIDLLFTCVGRRIELVELFRRAADALQIKLRVHGTDINWTAPAMHRVDSPHIVPRIDEEPYIPSLLELARRERIDLIIPTIDSDLPALSSAAARFAEIGTRVIISSESVVRTCRDKLTTCRLLQSAGIDTPQTWTLDEALALTDQRFPYYMKPREGSAEKGNYVIRSAEELRTLGARVPDPIVQEYIRGTEHTLDVYCGFDGVPRCVVPRKRLEVRTGEVSKGVIVKDERIMEIGRRVADVLGDCRGVITVQCMRTPEGRIRVIEINPRFGGGAPLAIEAGADFPRWLLAEYLGRKVRIDPLGFRDHLAMLRYDRSVFVDSLDNHQP